jgi:hypothetical protein
MHRVLLPSAMKENGTHVATKIFFRFTCRGKLRPNWRKYLKLPEAWPHAMLCGAASV